MPFTFSHPAIILPLRKWSGKRLSLTGLVAGSVTPDFEYFIRMKVESIYSHYVWGLFWFDVPLGVLLTFAYHCIVRNQLITNLPTKLNERLNNFRHFNWAAYFKANWPMVLVSILVGAATHLFWDSFTHPLGYFVMRIRFLRKWVVIAHMRIPLYAVLQHLSTLTGGIIVISALFSLTRKPAIQSTKKINYWLLVSAVTIIVFAARIFTGLNLHNYGDVIVTVISAFLIGLMVPPLIKPKWANASM